MKCSDDLKLPPLLRGRCIPPYFEEDYQSIGIDNGKFFIRLLEDKDMRFRAVYNGCFWEIEDGFDKESPLNGIAYSDKNYAIMLRDWLNENVKELSFKDKVRKVISELWDDDEIVVDECMGYTAVTEIKETCVTPSDIRAKLDDCYIEHHNICSGKSVFKISEGTE